MFRNNQHVNTSPSKLEDDMRHAEQSAMNGDITPLMALLAAHIGNEAVEAWAKLVNKARLEAEYRAWLPQEVWH